MMHLIDILMAVLQLVLLKNGKQRNAENWAGVERAASEVARARNAYKKAKNDYRRNRK